jgi:hypothetical protein
MPYPKPCRLCGHKFQPYTPFNKLCEECWTKSQSNKRKNYKSKNLNRNVPKKRITKKVILKREKNGYVRLDGI